MPLARTPAAGLRGVLADHRLGLELRGAEGLEQADGGAAFNLLGKRVRALLVVFADPLVDRVGNLDVLDVPRQVVLKLGRVDVFVASLPLRFRGEIVLIVAVVPVSTTTAAGSLDLALEGVGVLVDRQDEIHRIELVLVLLPPVPDEGLVIRGKRFHRDPGDLAVGQAQDGLLVFQGDQCGLDRLSLGVGEDSRLGAGGRRGEEDGQGREDQRFHGGIIGLSARKAKPKGGDVNGMDRRGQPG